MSQELLGAFASAVMGGSVRVVDLTQTLNATTPVTPLPPNAAPAAFSMKELASYEDEQSSLYWNNISLGEHVGTHFDAPAHWITGKDHPDGHTDTLAVQRLIGAAVVIDCVAETEADPCFMLRPEHIEAFEAAHGMIPAQAWVLMRTGWSKRTSPAAFLNRHGNGEAHTPGPSPEAMRLLVEERDITGWGVETVDTDHGHAAGFDPAFPAHAIMQGANRFGLASLTNLDQLPPTGAVLIAAPLKIERGSGSPVRVLALVPA